MWLGNEQALAGAMKSVQPFSDAPGDRVGSWSALGNKYVSTRPKEDQ